MIQEFVLWLHIVAAVTWIGGIVFLTVVGPTLRASGLEQAGALLRLMNRRFRDLSWLAVGVVVVTGLVNLRLRYGMGGAPLSPWLASKIWIVALMVGVKAAHDFLVGPRAAGNPQARRGSYWGASLFLGRLNLVLGLLVLFLSVVASTDGSH